MNGLGMNDPAAGPVALFLMRPANPASLYSWEFSISSQPRLHAE